MSDRIGKYLDGSLAITALTPEERLQAETIERVVDETRAFVDARPAPDVAAGVMRQIASERIQRPAPSGGGLSWWSRLWTVHVVTLRLRPIAVVPVVAALAAVAILVSNGRLLPAPDAPLQALQSSHPPSILLVQFRLQAPGATSVRLAGSFTGWQPQHDLHESAPGIWVVTIPLPAGVHDYAFVVDNQQWMSDPYALAVDDGFGGTNSRIALLPPDESRS